MCYNCGCQNPHDDMGDPNNITESTLQHLAEHEGKTIQEIKIKLLQMLEKNDKALDRDPHLQEMFIKAAKAWGQSVDEAKKYTQQLLVKEVKKIQ